MALPIWEIQNEANRRAREAFANSKGDVQPVAPAGVPAQAASDGVRLDAAEASRRISDWSRALFKNSTGVIL